MMYPPSIQGLMHDIRERYPDLTEDQIYRGAEATRGFLKLFGSLYAEQADAILGRIIEGDTDSGSSGGRDRSDSVLRPE
jgi:hypothetical protein